MLQRNRHSSGTKGSKRRAGLPAGGSSRKPFGRSLRFESLEDRRLLSTIGWTNRGTGPGAGDTDGFDAVFGASANLARQIVDRAINDWEEVIVNFNYAGGGNTLSLTVQTAAISSIASGGATANDNGKPTAGLIRVQNMAATHYLDPTPSDDTEFDDNITNAFTGYAVNPAISGTDFYATMLHEVGHVLGIGTSYAPLLINNLLTDTGIDDPSDTRPGNLFALNIGGGPIEATLTNADPGHFWEGPGTTATNAAGLPFHVDVLMNPGRAIAPNERNLISDFEATLLASIYGYDIVRPSEINNMLVNPNYTSDSLFVIGDVGGANDTISLRLGTEPGTLEVKVGGYTELVPLAEVGNIFLNSGGGNDTVRLHPLTGNRPINVNLGGGTDTLEISGIANGYESTTVTATTITSAGLNVIAYADVESLTLRTEGGNADYYIPSAHSSLTAATIVGTTGSETLNLNTLTTGMAVTIDTTLGNDTINIAPGGGMLAIRSPITINSGSGDDTISLAAGVAFGLQVINAPVTVNGGNDNDTMILSGGNLDAVSGLVTFNGGDQNGGLGNQILFHDTVPFLDYTYNITNTSVTRDPFFGGVSFFNTQRLELNGSRGNNSFVVGSGVNLNLELNGNDGNDNFTFGGGNVAPLAGQTFNGGSGVDQLTFDDHLRATGVIWDIYPAQVIYGGAFVFNTGGFEAIEILAGNGADDINLYNNIGSQLVTVDAGGGGDSVEAYNLRANSVTIEGGAGHDYLGVDDRSIAANVEESFFSASQVTRTGTNFSYVVGYDDFESLDFYLPSGSQNFATLLGSSPDIAPGFSSTIHGGLSDDVFVVIPRDGQGNSSLPSNVVLLGGPSADSVTVDDSASSLPIDYVLTNLFGPSVAHITGMGPGYLGVANDVESLTLNAGSGDDTFRIDSFKSGTGLTINAGAGGDLLEVTPVSKDVQANITSIASLKYNGGEGGDLFKLYNDNNPNPWLYDSTSSQISLQRLGGPLYFLAVNHSNVESLLATGGMVADQLQVAGVAAGTVLQYDGAGGADLIYVGNFMSTSGIAGGVVVLDSSGNDSITIDDRADTSGTTFHIGENYVGSELGDNLFGPGGYLYHGISTGTLTVRLGSGDDTVYAMPNPTMPLVLEGNLPTASDFLGLALAGVTNPVFTSLGPGAGSYTFGNAAPLSYTGFESTTIDDVAPFIVSQSYDETGTPSILIEFSEDVSTALALFHLAIVNTTTLELVPYGFTAMSYDSGTNTATFTFPGFPGERLPAGDYSATISPGLIDGFGNLLGAQPPLLFNVAALPPELPGDYNLNGAVEAADYVVWRKFLGATGVPAYTGADGDGDGAIDQDDYDVWSENFGESLPGSGGAEAVATSTSDSVTQPPAPPGVLWFDSPTAHRTTGKPPAEPATADLRRAADGGLVTLYEKRDDALAAWLASCGAERRDQPVEFNSVERDGMSNRSVGDSLDAIDVALEGLAAVGS